MSSSGADGSRAPRRVATRVPARPPADRRDCRRAERPGLGAGAVRGWRPRHTAAASGRSRTPATLRPAVRARRRERRAARSASLGVRQPARWT
jgi:hypothetical protein